MSVGPVTRGINSLLGRLSSVGPQDSQGPRGPAAGTAARPPVEAIKPLPQRPSFAQRYQQDAFEDTPRRGGRGARGGGGLDLSGGQQGFGAQGQGQGEGKGQAKAKQAPQASAAVGAAQGNKKQPVQVLEFRKGGPARERDEYQQQPQKAQGVQSDKGAGQKAQGAPSDQAAAQKKAQSDKDAAQKKPQKPQKPTPKPAAKPPEPELGSAFKKVMVAGEVKVVGRSMAERKQEAPAGKSEADAVAAAAAAASQSQ